MIKWKLNELMGVNKISGKDLAEKISQHPNTVSRMRRSECMPPINGELLDKLCCVLNCTPSDLIEFLPTSSEAFSSGSPKEDSLEKVVYQVVQVKEAITKHDNKELVSNVSVLLKTLAQAIDVS
jgi:putative transcriptional regulator